MTVKHIAETTGRDPTLSGIAHTEPARGHMVSDLADLRTHGCAAAAAVESGWIAALCQLNHEITGFVTARLTDNVQTQHALLSCRDVTEWQRIQSGFFQRAYEAYTEEARRLTELNTRLVRGAMAPWAGPGDAS